MKFSLVLLIVALTATAAVRPIRKTKRSPSPGGIHEGSHHGHHYGANDHYYHVDLPGSHGAVNNAYPSYYGHGHSHIDAGLTREVLGTKVHTHTHTQNTITKEVGVPVAKPYPVTVEKRIPVPVPQPYPVHIEKPVPVHVEVRVPVEVPKPYPVHVTQRVPVRVPVYVRVPEPVRVEVPVPRPYPVEVEKHVPVRVPVYVRVPVPVEAPQRPHVDHIDIHHTEGHGHRVVVTGSSAHAENHLGFGAGTGGYFSGSSENFSKVAGGGFIASESNGNTIHGSHIHGSHHYGDSNDYHHAHIDLKGY